MKTYKIADTIHTPEDLVSFMIKYMYSDKDHFNKIKVAKAKAKELLNIIVKD